jgi:LTXXQ motif family protein
MRASGGDMRGNGGDMRASDGPDFGADAPHSGGGRDFAGDGGRQFSGRPAGPHFAGRGHDGDRARLSTIGGNANLRSAAVQRSLNSHAMVNALHDRDALRDPGAGARIAAAIAEQHERNEHGWRHRHGGYGWVGPLFWPFAYHDADDYPTAGYGDDPSDYGYNDIYTGIFAPYGDDDLTGDLPPGGTSAHARHGARATADPATPQATAHPATPQATAHPAKSQANAHPATPQATADPAKSQANAHPATPQATAHAAKSQANAHPAKSQANARPTMPQANADPATPQPNARPTTPQADDHPITPQADAHPATPQATARPATPQADAHPMTPQADAHPTTPQATTHPATDQLTQTCGEDRRDVAGLPIDQIQRVIAPNDAQSAALDDLGNASVKAAQDIRAACPTEIPGTAPARLAVMQQRVEAMIAAVGTVQPALDKFYGLLNDEQKARLNAMGPNQRGKPAARKSGGSLARNCAAGQAGTTDWPTAEIEARLHPTDKQRASLTALVDASAKASNMLKDACQPDDPLTPPARLAATGKRLEVMLMAIRTVLAALDDFYDQLTEEQKVGFEAIGPAGRTAASDAKAEAGEQTAAPARRLHRRHRASIGDGII